MNQLNPNEALEIANVRLRLRRGLKFELHESGGQPSYVVQEGTSSGYYQLGIPEYAFVSLLDGQTTIQEAVQETSSKLGEDAFTIRDAIGTCQWLLKSRLADAVDASNTAQSHVGHLFEQLEENSRAKTLARVNPLFIKVPIGDPEPIIRKIAPLFGWISSKSFFVIWILTLIAAGFCLFQDGNGLASATLSIFAPNAWLWLIATFVGMKVIHEFAHGLFCHRLGCRVPETGLVLILFIPIPYVDVTSCWGVASKWRRIAVSAAGMYVELFVAAVATIAWSLTHDPVTKFHLFNVMLTGSLTTVLFNANFLMRFDGYYILSDLIGIPNLAQSGQQYIHYIGKRYLLGMNVNQARHQPGQGLTICSYGVAALVWRIFICISLSILASALFFGFGIALAILGIAMWVGIPLFRLLAMCTGKSGNAKPNLKWFAGVTIPVIAAATVALFMIPWPFQVSAPAIVQYQDAAIVRAEVAGFIRETQIANGSMVEAGEILLRLENAELAAKLQGLEAAREISLVRSRRHHSKREIPQYQSEVGVRVALEKQIEELKLQQLQLVIRAPRNGSVVASQIDSMLNQHVKKGVELFKIVDESDKEIVMVISQDDFPSFSGAMGDDAVFSSSNSSNRQTGTLTSVEPTASTTTDIRLTSYAGGPLAVRPASHHSSRLNDDSFELVHPRFRAVLNVPHHDDPELKPGLIGQVRINRYPRSIATHIVVGLRQWITGCIETANQ